MGLRRADVAFGGRADVVLRHPLALISSSPGTTSLCPIAALAGRTWCFTAR